jgi:hypothetical protein
LSAVKNYADAKPDCEPEYRKNVGNFFGRDAIFQAYLPGAYRTELSLAAERDFLANRAKYEAEENQLAADSAKNGGKCLGIDLEAIRARVALPKAKESILEPANAEFEGLGEGDEV